MQFKELLEAILRKSPGLSLISVGKDVAYEKICLPLVDERES